MDWNNPSEVGIILCPVNIILKRCIAYVGINLSKKYSICGGNDEG